MESSKQFAKYLREGIYSVKAREGKNIGPIKEELAELINLAPSTIDHWYKKRGTPAQAEYVEKVAQEIICRGHMDERWLKNFITSAGYPYLVEPLTQKIFPSIQNEHNEILTQKNKLPPMEPLLTTQCQASKQEKFLDWTSLQKLCKKIQERSIENIRAKHDPDLYLQRTEVIGVFNDFIQSEQQIMVITGKSGVGKTNFVYSLLDSDFSGHICFLGYDSSYLDQRQGIEERLDQDFQNYGQFSDFAQALRSVPEDDQLRFVLVIDAINEHNEPGSLLRDIDRTIYKLDIPWLKVVITSRPETWRQIYRGAKSLTESLYYHPNVSQAKYAKAGVDLAKSHTAEPNYHLSQFQAREIKTVYRKYQHKFRLKTAYRDLNLAVRETISDPLGLLLVARTYSQQEIPESLSPHRIYQSYIDFMTESGQLDIYDEVFLREDIVPLMVKRLPYRNEVTYSQIKRHLRAENVKCLQNLIDANILIRYQKGFEQGFRFTFERFYDYFAGEYFLKRCSEEKDPKLYIENLAQHIQKTPFLWGPVMMFLYESFAEQNDTLIEQLGHTNDEFLLQMIMALLDEQYSQNQSRVQSLLQCWFEKMDETNNQLPRIITYIAIKHQIKKLLNQLLLHPNKKVRTLVVQDIYTLWEQAPELTRQILSNLTERIQAANSPILLTLLDASFLLFLQEYQAQTGISNQIASRTQSVSLTQSTGQLETIFLLSQIWQPILNRWLGGNRLSKSIVLQRIGALGLRRFFGVQIISQLEQGQRQRFSFDLASTHTLFPLTEERRAAMQRLIVHFDAAIDEAPAPVDNLVELILELVASGEENFWIIYTAHLSLIAHLKNNPIYTTRAIEKLLTKIEQLYPPSANIRNQPTAPIWYPMISHVFPGLGYEGYIRIGTEQAEQVLSSYMSILRRRACDYGDVWRRDPAANKLRDTDGDYILRLDCLQPLLYGYVLGIPEAGQDMLFELVDFYIKTEDHDHIQWGVYSLATGMNRYNALDEGLEALRDFIQRIQDSGYLEQLSSEDYTTLWQKWGDDLFYYANKYREHLANLLDMLDDQKTPDIFKIRLRNVSWQDNVMDFNLMEGITWLLGRATQDSNPNSLVRHMIIWFFKNILEAKDVEQVMVDIVFKYVNYESL